MSFPHLLSRMESVAHAFLSSWQSSSSPSLILPLSVPRPSPLSPPALCHPWESASDSLFPVPPLAPRFPPQLS
ncbi:hypothetical protein CLOM_g23796 [Closterium sp. NIES-68]|nr:hypothetical protein CLOM_g23796 [Closterium sp. NIES-68]GJP69620.1 hypothetical protein CLOP_g612 [Closterium sp. NIES-67]